MSRHAVAVVVCLSVGFPLDAVAQPADPGPAPSAEPAAGGNDEVEELDEVDVVPADRQGAGPKSAADFIGRLHPSLVHLPIGWFFLVALVDVLGLGFRRKGWQACGLWGLVATAVIFLPAVGTGLLREDNIGADAAGAVAGRSPRPSGAPAGQSRRARCASDRGEGG